MISWSHSRKHWSTKSNRCLFPSRRRGWRSTSTSLKTPHFSFVLRILEGYFLEDIHTLIIVKSSFDLSHQILGNYKSLPWMFRPFLVGFPDNHYHLRWPTCGLVAINCLDHITSNQRKDWQQFPGVPASSWTFTLFGMGEFLSNLHGNPQASARKVLLRENGGW